MYCNRICIGQNVDLDSRDEKQVMGETFLYSCIEDWPYTQAPCIYHGWKQEVCQEEESG